MDALGRARSVTGEVGFGLVALDVIGDGRDESLARRIQFFRRPGFQRFQDCPERIFIAIDTARSMFGDGWGL